jgi:predicted  nucleic acid-binding Zn-ribbon protein
MPIDLSGKTMNEQKSDVINNITVIKPYESYDLNLDNLENIMKIINRFNEEGHVNSLYRFKLLDNGMYLRQEIKTIKTYEKTYI